MFMIDSPFLEYPDYAPKPSEANQIQHLIEKQRATLGEMDEEMNVLAERQMAYRRSIVEHAALLAPIRRLSRDVLSYVFLVSLPDSENGSDDAQISGRHQLVVLSHVCRQWRRISLAMPLLWAEIVIKPPPYPFVEDVMSSLEEAEDALDALNEWNSEIGHLVELTNLWATRSAECPLKVILIIQYHRFCEESPGGDDPMIGEGMSLLEELVTILCSTSSRWEEVHLSYYFSTLTAPFLRLLQLPADQFPLLETLNSNITFNDEDQSSKAAASSIGLFNSPSLRALSVYNLWKEPSTLSVEWHALTCLSFGGYVQNDRPTRLHTTPPQFDRVRAVALLKKCPNLVHCTLVLDTEAFTTASALSYGPVNNVLYQIRLPHLQSLSVAIDGVGRDDLFPKSIIAPSLRRLTILCTYLRRDPWPMPVGLVDATAIAAQTVAWITHFGHQLKSVDLDCTPLLGPYSLHLCLEQLPNVTELVLKNTSGKMVHSIFSRLIPEYDYSDNPNVTLARTCLHMQEAPNVQMRD